MNKLNKIVIKDYPCGSGKTTNMISNFEPDKKYLVIVPYLSEVKRVIDESNEVPFCEPVADKESEGRKYHCLEHQLLFGLNVVTTHKLYSEIVHLARQGLLDDYDIIIDEVLEVCQVVTSKSSYSIKEFYIEPGFIEVDKDGCVSPTEKWDQYQSQVSDTLDERIYLYAQSGCLFLLGDHLFIWALPPELLTSGLSLTILTYKSQGSMLLAYLKKLGHSPIVEQDKVLERKFRRQASNLVTVKRIPSIEKLNLTYSGQREGMKNKKYCGTVSNALKNLRGRELKGIPPSDILITCSKDLWFHNGINKTNANLKTSGFSRNSKMFGANWIANTTRGTNDYSHCSTLIYLYDQNPNPFIKQWLGHLGKDFSDAYALTELIQWVWRSRVRNGEPITLYLPSDRMRSLFKDWLKGEDIRGYRLDCAFA